MSGSFNTKKLTRCLNRKNPSNKLFHQQLWSHQGWHLELLIQIAFLNLELSSRNSSFVTARSGMLNANLFFVMLSMDTYSSDDTLSFKHVTNNYWSTISKLLFSFSFQNLISACKNDIFDVYPAVTVTLKLLEGFVYLKTSLAFLMAQLRNATIFTGSSFFRLPKISWCCWKLCQFSDIFLWNVNAPDFWKLYV